MRESFPPVLNELIDAYFPIARSRGLDDGERAEGECWVAAAGFAELASRFGIGSEWVEFSVDQHPDYSKRPVLGGFGVHAVTLLDLCGQTVLVDWTASQYGFSEFPLVRPWVEGDVPVEDRSIEPVDCNGDRLDTSFINSVLSWMRERVGGSVLQPV